MSSRASSPIRSHCCRGSRPLSLAGGNRTLALAIVAVILLNATLPYAQELQAERATEALKELLPPHARVRRDDQEQEIPASALVPPAARILASAIASRLARHHRRRQRRSGFLPASPRSGLRDRVGCVLRQLCRGLLAVAGVLGEGAIEHVLKTG